MSEYKPEETAVIILGDAGFNFWLNGTDKKYKKLACAYGYTIYCVRGNHEERPENLGYALEYDENVKNMVYVDAHCANIRYFVDGNEYNINGHSILVIGGAYSVDKWLSLARAGYSPKEANIADPKKCGWFKDEQLTPMEMGSIWDKVSEQSYDFIFTHTCPLPGNQLIYFCMILIRPKLINLWKFFLTELRIDALGAYGVLDTIMPTALKDHM